jgi:hypothetical protein
MATIQPSGSQNSAICSPTRYLGQNIYLDEYLALFQMVELERAISGRMHGIGTRRLMRFDVPDEWITEHAAVLTIELAHALVAHLVS